LVGDDDDDEVELDDEVRSKAGPPDDLLKSKSENTVVVGDGCAGEGTLDEVAGATTEAAAIGTEEEAEAGMEEAEAEAELRAALRADAAASATAGEAEGAWKALERRRASIHSSISGRERAWR
jgi:hypothetical protein